MRRGGGRFLVGGPARDGSGSTMLRGQQQQQPPRAAAAATASAPLPLPLARVQHRALHPSLPSARQASCVLRAARPASVIRMEQRQAGFVRGGSSILGGGLAAPAVYATAMSLQQQQRRGLAAPSAATTAGSEAAAAGEGVVGGFATEREYHDAADETLDEVVSLVEGLEETVEDFEANLSQGVLNIVMGEHGTWVLNKQTPNRQVWWSSPISGPMRFEFDPAEGAWRSTRGDRQELFQLLAEEVYKVSGVDVLKEKQGKAT